MTSAKQYMMTVLGAAAEKTVPGSTAVTKVEQISDAELSTIPPRLIPAVLLGLAGAFFWKKHRVLGALGGLAVGGSIYPLIKGDYVGPTLAIGSTAAGIGASLMWKQHPILGYIAGDVGLLALTAPYWTRRL